MELRPIMPPQKCAACGKLLLFLQCFACYCCKRALSSDNFVVCGGFPYCIEHIPRKCDGDKESNKASSLKFSQSSAQDTSRENTNTIDSDNCQRYSINHQELEEWLLSSPSPYEMEVDLGSLSQTSARQSVASFVSTALPPPPRQKSSHSRCDQPRAPSLLPGRSSYIGLSQDGSDPAAINPSANVPFSPQNASEDEVKCVSGGSSNSFLNLPPATREEPRSFPGSSSDSSKTIVNSTLHSPCTTFNFSDKCFASCFSFAQPSLPPPISPARSDFEILRRDSLESLQSGQSTTSSTMSRLAVRFASIKETMRGALTRQPSHVSKSSAKGTEHSNKPNSKNGGNPPPSHATSNPLSKAFGIRYSRRNSSRSTKSQSSPALHSTRKLSNNPGARLATLPADESLTGLIEEASFGKPVDPVEGEKKANASIPTILAKSDPLSGPITATRQNLTQRRPGKLNVGNAEKQTFASEGSFVCDPEKTPTFANRRLSLPPSRFSAEAESGSVEESLLEDALKRLTFLSVENRIEEGIEGDEREGRDPYVFGEGNNAIEEGPFSDNTQVERGGGHLLGEGSVELHGALANGEFPSDQEVPPIKPADALTITTVTALHKTLATRCDMLISSTGKELALAEEVLDICERLSTILSFSGVNVMSLAHASACLTKHFEKWEDGLGESLPDAVNRVKDRVRECVDEFVKGPRVMAFPMKGYRVEGPNRVWDPTESNGTQEKEPWANSRPEREPMNYSEWPIEHLDLGCQWFRQYFVGKEHRTYCGVVEGLGPVIVSVVREPLTKIQLQSDSTAPPKMHYQFRLIVRRKELPDIRLVIPEWAVSPPPTRSFLSRRRESSASLLSTSTPSNLIWDTVVQMSHPQLATARLHTLFSDPFERQLLRLDEMRYTRKYKVGVLYVAPGQQTEAEWFGNKEGSEAFDRFLDEVVGRKVELNGWNGWAGGLDTRGEEGGRWMYWNQIWGDFEIAYHVSTLLPWKQGDRYQVARKKHIGNDIVCIIFVEGRQPINPAMIKSQFLHVFIIVHPEPHSSSEAYYRVEVVVDDEVPAFGPPLPDPPIFKASELKTWILAKVIGGENAAYKASKISAPQMRARQGFIEDMVGSGWGSPNASSYPSSNRGVVGGVSGTGDGKGGLGGLIRFPSLRTSASTSESPAGDRQTLIMNPFRRGSVKQRFQQQLQQKERDGGVGRRSRSEQDLILVTSNS
ncbi:uncharacterized protein VTP21DRAFT_1320 [Calcarisporiella thermophila]|uniref:uncharacterized protein n=1 Tax=Calcarisporiella thermophila TaxID=911321 RepID=UPI003743F252